MDKILIIGCAGAGKSTFAKQLAEISGLPLIHLDQHFWGPRWTETNKESWAKKVTELASQPKWIMDGNYSGTLPIRLDHAEKVIFLDLPRTLCLLRVIKRTINSFGKTRQDMAADCKEQFDWEFIKYIWNFPRNNKPRLVNALNEFSNATVVLKSSADVEDYITELTSSKGRSQAQIYPS